MTGETKGNLEVNKIQRSFSVFFSLDSVCGWGHSRGYYRYQHKKTNEINQAAGTGLRDNTMYEKCERRKKIQKRAKTVGRVICRERKDGDRYRKAF